VIFGIDNLMSPAELAGVLGLSADTLADWRSQRRGPAYFSVGRKIRYPRDRVEKWLQTKLKETEEDGNTQAKRDLALPVQVGRPRLQRDHKLGRHHTKREQSEAA
jgi:excisionase family DNA binding protein